MISVKYAVIMAVGAFAAGSFFASPLPEAIASTIANDVICNGCVGTSDLAGNAVTAAKIKDGEVKAAEIAANAVGASEIAGVTKLVFTSCTVDMFNGIPASSTIHYNCSVPAAATGDTVVATITENNFSSGILLKFVSNVGSGSIQFGFHNTSTFEVPDGADVEMGLVIFRN